MAYNEINNTMFAPGVPIDSATLVQMNENTKSTQAFPKVCYFQVDHSNEGGTKTLILSNMKDPDGIGATIVGRKVWLPKGEYYCNAPIKIHRTGGAYVTLYDETGARTLSNDEVYAHSGASVDDMNNAVIQCKFKLDVDSYVYFTQRHGSGTNYTYESHCIFMQLR